MAKNVLITGAAKRIGRAIALDLAKRGWNVVAHYNKSQADAESLKSEIEKNGQKCYLVQADLSDSTAAKQVVKDAVKGAGELSCLINNASSFKRDEFDDFDEESWDFQMKTNLLAPLMLAQEFSKQVSADNFGNIVNMLDYSVLSQPDKFFSYSVSKSAMWFCTQNLAKRLAPNIRVNAIGPGHSLPNYKETEESFLTACEKTPIGKPSKPQEICNAIAFILSSETMTGQIIALDAGKHLISAEYY